MLLGPNSFFLLLLFSPPDQDPILHPYAVGIHLESFEE